MEHYFFKLNLNNLLPKIDRSATAVTCLVRFATLYSYLALLLLNLCDLPPCTLIWHYSSLYYKMNVLGTQMQVEVIPEFLVI